jgi:hypothetical protein
LPVFVLLAPYGNPGLTPGPRRDSALGLARPH